MHLSQWRDRAPTKDAMSPKVMAVIQPILAALGSRADHSSWVLWGETPASRYLVFSMADAGLLQINVRVNVPQEGPRASAKLIRWSRVQTGELGIEIVAGHRLLSFQLEGQILRGSDDDADAIAAFALEIFAAIDGRPFTRPATGTKTRKPSKPAAKRSATVPRLDAPRERAS